MNKPHENSMARKDATPRKYSFGEFVLDLDRGALQKKGADVPLRPKCFEVLCYLVEHHGVLLSKEELLAAVWVDVIVTDDSLTHCLIEIRKVLGDESKEDGPYPAAPGLPVRCSRQSSPARRSTATHSGTRLITTPSKAFALVRGRRYRVGIGDIWHVD